jgi:hypothetical protein
MTNLVAIPTTQGVTALDIETQISNIKIDKHNSIVLMTLAKLLEDKVAEAKEYLLSRCDDCEVYTSGQLQLKRTDAERTTFINDKITKLKSDIKKEEERIKKDNSLGEVKKTPYTSFKIVK